MRVHVVDPSAFTPPYDHALCAALADEGIETSLVTSAFAYGAVPAADRYDVRELFYRRALGAPGSPARRAAKLAQHVPDMLRYRRIAEREADLVHFQWLDVQWLDPWLLPRGRPLVLTAHDLLPREPKPGQAQAQRRAYDAVDAIVVHSEYGRSQLVDHAGIDAGTVHVIHHGAFDHLTRVEGELPLPDTDRPVALFFGLLRPYKGVETLLKAWRGIDDAELWVVGRPRGLDVQALQAGAPPGVRFVSRYVSDGEAAALFRRADMVVLPYARTERFDQSGVLATALAFGRPSVISDIGGFGEIAATGAAQLVPPDDSAALHAALAALFADRAARDRLAAAARAAAAGPYSWATAAQAHVALYGELQR